MLTSTLFVFREDSPKYIELAQPNPIRWSICLYEDDKFVQQTGWFKCRDFFNDMSALYNGANNAIYRMDTSKIKVNSYGVFLLMKETTPQFVGNVVRCVAPKYKEEMGGDLHPVPVEDMPGHVLLLLPKDLVDNTFSFSFITLLLRACNDVKEFSCYDHLITESVEPLVENYKGVLKELSLKRPAHLQQYWWWANTINSETTKETSYEYQGCLHDNGVISWFRQPQFKSA